MARKENFPLIEVPIPRPVKCDQCGTLIHFHWGACSCKWRPELHRKRSLPAKGTE